MRKLLLVFLFGTLIGNVGGIYQGKYYAQQNQVQLIEAAQLPENTPDLLVPDTFEEMYKNSLLFCDGLIGAAYSWCIYNTINGCTGKQIFLRPELHFKPEHIEGGLDMQEKQIIDNAGNKRAKRLKALEIGTCT